MKKKLVIVGATSNARLARVFFSKDSDYEPVAFTVNEKYITSPTFEGLPVVPFESLTKSHPPDLFHAFVAVGYNQMNKVRENLYKETKAKGYTLPNYISSRCSFLTDEPIGDNNLILEDNTIQPFVKMGSNNVLWSGNHVGHDAIIGDHTFITSHVVISGFTEIGNNAFLGVNCTLRDAIQIAPETLVAAGATVMKSTQPKQVILPPRSTVSEKLSDQLTIS